MVLAEPHTNVAASLPGHGDPAWGSLAGMTVYLNDLA